LRAWRAVIRLGRRSAAELAESICHRSCAEQAGGRPFAEARQPFV